MTMRCGDRAIGAPFWYYGYDDIYAGLFGPYDYDGLSGYLPPRGSTAPHPTG